MNPTQNPRRRFLTFGAAALAAIPVIAISHHAEAATNAALRTALKYQNKPEGDKNCANCLHFVPVADAKKPGSCKILPGDTEIAPQAYCIGWVKKG